MNLARFPFAAAKAGGFKSGCFGFDAFYNLTGTLVFLFCLDGRAEKLSLLYFL